MATQQDLPLPAPAPSGIVIISTRCLLRAEGEHRVVVVAGLPVHHYSANDAVAEAYAMVFLVGAGYATQRDVAKAFGCSDRTVRRHQERYQNGGMAALAKRSGWRPGWVNDRSGDPLFVITASANAGMTKMLPEVVAEVRGLVGDRRVTMVFDRGGWSPQLFQDLLGNNFDILTYRKGTTRRISEGRFVLRRAKIDGRSIEYRLHDQPVRFLKGKLRLRQVTRLSDDGHQTPVITSRWDLVDIEIAYRMFERWQQENFFKYLREEFLLDALVDYQVEPDDPTRTVPNPQRHTLDKEVRTVRAEVAELEQAYGVAAVDNPEVRRPTMRGFKIAHGKIGKQLRETRERLADLLTRRRALPERVEVRDVTTGAVVKLATERKHLTNLIKMVAYQAESDIFALLSPHYARNDDEGRTLLHELFRTAADITVADGELRLTLHPLSSPHRTQAVAALCETLTATATVFPGSRLRMRLGIQPPPQIGLAFPGPRPPKSATAADASPLKADTSREG